MVDLGYDFSLEFSFNRVLEANSSMKMLTSARVSVPGKSSCSGGGG